MPWRSNWPREALGVTPLECDADISLVFPLGQPLKKTTKMKCGDIAIGWHLHIKYSNFTELEKVDDLFKKIWEDSQIFVNGETVIISKNDS